MASRLLKLSAILLFGTCLPVLAADMAAGSPFRLRLADATQYRLQAPVADQRNSDDALAHPFSDAVRQAATTHGVDAALLRAVIGVESAWRADAVSPKGAIGLMQLMPDTARRFGTTRPAEPVANLNAGTAYLRHLIDSHGSDLNLALAAYNAGEGAVRRHRGIPPYAETQAYVPRVLAAYARLKEQSASPYKLRKGAPSAMPLSSRLESLFR